MVTLTSGVGSGPSLLSLAGSAFEGGGKGKIEYKETRMKRGGEGVGERGGGSGREREGRRGREREGERGGGGAGREGEREREKNQERELNDVHCIQSCMHIPFVRRPEVELDHVLAVKWPISSRCEIYARPED